MLKIYGLNLSTPSNKVRYTANALNLDYEFTDVDLKSGAGQKPEYLAIHPLGKVPAIDDSGFKLFESGAICRYLAAKAESDLYPSEIKERALVDQWIDYSTLHVQNAVSKIVFNTIFYKLMSAEKDERSLSEGLAWFDKYVPLLESKVSESKFLVGDKLSLADIYLLAVLDPCEVSNIDISKYPALSAWRKELSQSDFYQNVHTSFESSFKSFMGG